MPYSFHCICDGFFVQLYLVQPMTDCDKERKKRNHRTKREKRNEVGKYILNLRYRKWNATVGRDSRANFFFSFFIYQVKLFAIAEYCFDACVRRPCMSVCFFFHSDVHTCLWMKLCAKWGIEDIYTQKIKCKNLYTWSWAEKI